MRMIETHNLTVGYDKKAVVRAVNISVKEGQLVSLLGPNGSGKSTVIKTLAALIPPIEGSIFILGQHLKDIKRKELSKTLSVVLTEKVPVGLLSGFEVVSMGRHPHTGFMGGMRDSDKEIVWDCLGMVNAEDIAHRLFNELSDGEKQKILIARALAQKPDLIILDEPTTHLDIRHKLEVLSILKKLCREQKITVLLALHEVDLALKICDMAIMIKNKEILAKGLPEVVGDNAAIRNLFDIENAGFNAFLGLIELSNLSSSKLFVVGGGGMGTSLYRKLTRNNIGFSTGILHENDVDYHIAETMGVHIVKEKPFGIIGKETLEEARKLIAASEIVIDSGFPVTETNNANINLIAEALKNRKRVYTFRDELENKHLFGELSRDLLDFKLYEGMC